MRAFDPTFARPREDGVGGELRTVVRDDHARLAALRDQRRQFAGDALPGKRRVRDRRQAFAGYVVDDIRALSDQAAS